MSSATVSALVVGALEELLSHPLITLFLRPVVDQYPEVAEARRPRPPPPDPPRPR